MTGRILRNAHRYAPDSEMIEDVPADTPCFLPVEIVDRAENDTPAPALAPNAASSSIEIDIASGHRLRINGAYDPDALARLIRGLSV